MVRNVDPSTFSTMPTCSMASMSLDPDQEKKTSAPGSGLVPQASFFLNHFACSMVAANSPVQSWTPAWLAAQARNMSHQGAVAKYESPASMFLAYQSPYLV